MSRSPDGPDSDLLFDLPLDTSVDEVLEPTAAVGGVGGDGDQVGLTFDPDEDPQPLPPIEAPLQPRFIAALLDFVVLVAVLGFALATLRLLAIPVNRAVIAPLALFLGSFSFLYQVMPLAFWGHTPGMAYAGIHSRAKNGDFMTIRQCTLRWVGWVVTVATAGLAALAALSGVSLSDLLSGTRSFLRPAS